MKSLKNSVPILCVFLCATLVSLAQPPTKDEEIEKMLKIGVPEEIKQEKREVSDEKKLPRVLLIGDSISGGYLGGVSSQLKGVATVVRGNNAGDSRGGLEQIEKILGTEPWDVIHFNWGLHDMTWQFRMKPEERGIEQYAARLEKLVQRLDKTGAKLIWATTTPWCPEDYEYIEKRFKQKYDYAGEGELKWKKAALEVMGRHNIAINDLHSLLSPKLAEFLNKPNDIHFNGKGSAAMAEQISKVVSEHLNATPTLKAQCSVPFSDNAVLQRGIPLPVWGKSLPQAKVTVSFEKQTKTAVADKNGGWRVMLDPLTAIKLNSPNEVPKGERMTITTELDGKSETATLENLVVGDVWICAGQSNMAGGVRAKGGGYPEGTIAEANYPGFRHKLTSGSDPWVASAPDTCPAFKQVAFFFGRDVYRETLVPIGIVAAAVGGSNIESWLNQETSGIGGNYQKLIAPIVGYGIRGMVWYQGESNTKDGLKYQPKLTSLIEGWRKAWNQGDFPFYIVQLPGMGKTTEEGANPAGGGDWPETRQAQFQTLAVKNTGMAVTIDIGDASVHPPNKYDTGRRLARLALHNDYGFTNLVPTGPLYESQKIEGDTIRIKFQHAGNGLMFAEKNGILPPEPSPGKKLESLAVQAKDGTWHWADGRIDGSDLLVSSKDVKEPIAVRYAYISRPVGCMLYNKDGLPAAPFATYIPDGVPSEP